MEEREEREREHRKGQQEGGTLQGPRTDVLGKVRIRVGERREHAENRPLC